MTGSLGYGMARFPLDIASQAFHRQGGRCALCGNAIVWEFFDASQKGAWHAHHASGDVGDLRAENCVCLCIRKPECNVKAHDEHFGKNEILFRIDYPYWDG